MSINMSMEQKPRSRGRPRLIKNIEVESSKANEKTTPGASPTVEKKKRGRKRKIVQPESENINLVIEKIGKNSNNYAVKNKIRTETTEAKLRYPRRTISSNNVSTESVSEKEPTVDNHDDTTIDKEIIVDSAFDNVTDKYLPSPSIRENEDIYSEEQLRMKIMERINENIFGIKPQATSTPVTSNKRGRPKKKAETRGRPRKQPLVISTNDLASASDNSTTDEEQITLTEIIDKTNISTESAVLEKDQTPNEDNEKQTEEELPTPISDVIDLDDSSESDDDQNMSSNSLTNEYGKNLLQNAVVKIPSDSIGYNVRKIDTLKQAMTKNLQQPVDIAIADDIKESNTNLDTNVILEYPKPVIIDLTD